MAFARRNQDNRQVYGVSGGGNLPRPNDRIPVGYGTFWAQPDLTQPDYFRAIEETSMILFKRMCIGLGEYRLKEIRVNGTTMWTGDAATNSGVITAGMTAPFPGCRIELLNGQASTLVPSSVITSPSVTGNIIPLSDNPNPVLGPFAVNPVGTVVTKLQVDISCSSYHHNNHQSWRDLWVEYAPINDAGTPIGAWQTLHRSTGDVFITKTLRWTYMVDVPAGRYAVRARNNTPKPAGQYNMDFVWDALRGYVPDTIVRAGMTEIAMEIKAGEGLNQTSFADVQVKVQRWGLVYDQSTGTWVEGPIGKCVDIFVDMLRDASYGGAVPTDLIDVSKVVAYRNALTQFDTFDGVIRGPVTLWDAMTQVLSNMRAEPVRIGAGYTFIRDEPSAIKRHVFSRSQIVRDTVVIEEAPKANEGEAHVVIEFSPDSDPKRKETATAFYGQESMTPRRISWPGVSSYEHAMHLARWFAASGYYRRTTITFDTELAGRIPLRGQPILVDPWFVEARKVSAAVGLSGTTLTLDSDIEVAANDRVILRTQRGREWGPVRVTQGATLREIVLDPADVAAEAGATGIPLADVIAPLTSILTSVVVGQLADIGTVWLMSSMEPGEDGRTSITAKIDAAEVYAAIDENIPPISPLTWALVPIEAPTIEVLTAQVVQHTSSLVVQWGARAQVGAVRYEVQVSYATDTDTWEQIYVGPSPTGEAPIRYLSTGEPVYLRVRAFGSTGLTGGWTQTSMVTPKPIVMATGAEAGAMDWLSNDAAVRGAFETMIGRLDQAEQTAHEIAASVAALDDARQRGAEVAATRLTSESARAKARLEDVRVALAAEDSALTLRMATAESSIGEARASITDIQTTEATLKHAFAGLGIDIEAALGSASAGGFLRILAQVDGGGALAALLLGVATTQDGASKEAALRLVASGTRTLIQLYADQTQFLDTAGLPFAAFDGATRTLLADRIRSGTSGIVTQHVRPLPGSKSNMGVGTTAGGAGNAYRNYGDLGTFVIDANPLAIGTGAPASNYAPVVTTMGLHLDTFVGGGVSSWGGPYNVQARLVANNGASDFVLADGIVPPVIGAVIGGSFTYSYINTTASFTGYAELPAGVYTVRLEARYGPGSADGISEANAIAIGARALIDARRK